MQAFGNSLFVREGIVAATDTAGQEYIDYDTDSLAYCIQRTDTGESIKIINSAFAEKEAEIKLVAEYRDYYIFFYSCLREGIHKRIGYIDKDDFHNDRDGIVLPAPF